MFGDPCSIRKMRSDICKWKLPYPKITQKPFYAFSYLMEKNLTLTCSAFMIRKKNLEGLDFDSPYDAWFDWWLLSQLSLRGRFYWIPEKATFWRKGAASYLNLFNRNIDLYRESLGFAGRLFDLMQKFSNFDYEEGRYLLRRRLRKELEKRRLLRKLISYESSFKIPIRRILHLLARTLVMFKKIFKSIVGDRFYISLKWKWIRLLYRDRACVGCHSHGERGDRGRFQR